MSALEMLDRIDPVDLAIKYEGEWWQPFDLPEEKSDLLEDILFVREMVEKSSYADVEKLLNM